VKVWIDRDTCDSNLATCETCFGQFLRTGVPDRGCMLAWKDDGSEDITVHMRTEGVEHMIVVPAHMREIVAYEGWPQYVDFHVRFRKNEYPDEKAV
jgi:hypothetical protein